MATKRRASAARSRWDHINDTWLSRYPCLLGFLGDTQFEEGDARLPGSLLVQMDDLALKAKLSDREECVSCWVTASDFSALLDAVELAAGGEGDWRVDKWLVDAARRRAREKRS